MSFRLSALSRNPVAGNGRRIPRSELGAAREQVGVTRAAPSVDRVDIEVTGVGVWLRKASGSEGWQCCIERFQRQPHALRRDSRGYIATRKQAEAGHQAATPSRAASSRAASIAASRTCLSQML